MPSRILLVALCFVSASWAQIGVFQSVDDFINEAFTETPSIETLWLNNETREQIERALNRSFQALRIRYWRHGGRTAWILHETGKELPITVGVVVENNKIVALSVLEYRESRGGEVRYPLFRDQFFDAELNNDQVLSKHIHGITGATLSVSAIKRVATAALLCHQIAVDVETSP